jgi:hypothetical protein
LNLHKIKNKDITYKKQMDSTNSIFNIAPIFMGNCFYIMYSIKCLNTINNFIFITYILLLIIKSSYFLTLTKILSSANIKKNICIINFVSTLFFTLIITYYYIIENYHNYSQKGLFIWSWVVQLIFMLFLYIEISQFKNKVKIN